VKYRAVIFDLGGTLTYGLAWSVYVDAAGEIAGVIAAPKDDFVRIWFEEAEGLGTGVYPSFQDFIRHICRQLSLDVTDNLVDVAAGISISTARRHLTMPRDAAIDLLSYLKTNGYKTGLVSDCGPDVPTVWDDTPFAPLINVAVFSCAAGMNKGDPRIFQIALKKLDVAPEECIYIADGMRNELANAAGLGMTAVQLLVSEEIDDSPIREDWHGPMIKSLNDILSLL
jgi:putative hydrolase of the HAD superfamily